MRIMFAAVLGALLCSTPVFAAEEAEKAPQNFVYLKPFVLPVLSKTGGIDQFISVTVTLELDDTATADKVHAIAPRIVDAYLQDLYGAIGTKNVMRDGVLDPIALKAEFEASNNRVLGTIPCKVLLQNIGQRSIGEHPSAS